MNLTPALWNFHYNGNCLIDFVDMDTELLWYRPTYDWQVWLGRSITNPNQSGIGPKRMWKYLFFIFFSWVLEKEKQLCVFESFFFFNCIAVLNPLLMFVPFNYLLLLRCIHKIYYCVYIYETVFIYIYFLVEQFDRLIEMFLYCTIVYIQFLYVLL